MVEEDQLGRRCIRREKRRNERAKASLLQDGLQDAATLFSVPLDEHLDIKEDKMRSLELFSLFITSTRDVVFGSFF